MSAGELFSRQKKQFPKETRIFSFPFKDILNFQPTSLRIILLNRQLGVNTMPSHAMPVER